MFNKYECGCVGFVLFGMDPAKKKVVCVTACDDDGRGPVVFFFERPKLLLKASVPLPDEEVAALIGRIGTLVGKGHRLDDLRDAFRAAGVGNV